MSMQSGGGLLQRVSLCMSGSAQSRSVAHAMDRQFSTMPQGIPGEAGEGRAWSVRRRGKDSRQRLPLPGMFHKGSFVRPAVLPSRRAFFAANWCLILAWCRNTLFACILAGCLGAACMAQTPKTPNIEAQRAAMKKLASGMGEDMVRARLRPVRGAGQFVDLVV